MPARKGEDAVSNAAARGRGEKAGPWPKLGGGFGGPESEVALGAWVEAGADADANADADADDTEDGREMAAEENAGAEAEAKPEQSAEESSSVCIKAAGGGRGCQRTERRSSLRKAWS